MLDANKVLAKLSKNPLSSGAVALTIATGDKTIERTDVKHRRAVQAALARLVESGSVIRSGEKRGTRYVQA